jgi:tetratricopeptide (TPR) repeat protein
MPPLLLVWIAAELFELHGRIAPPAHASVSIFRVTSSFTASTLSEIDGRFTFKKLEPGAYTVSIFIPALGEARRTVEVGSGQAVRRLVSILLNLKDDDFAFSDILSGRHTVSAKQLAIPAKAIREYEYAQRDLAKNDAEGARRHLEKAVEIAPNFAPAWNHLGTMAYKTQQYERAAECFRAGLAADPELYEPLVNLGGVLLNLNQPEEALQLNRHAVLTRPNDALANAQLGMAYFQLGNMEMAEKHLQKAVDLDPAHFSHPQLLLAQIHLERGERPAAAEDLEDFLKRHPDSPLVAELRAKIAALKQ